MICTKGDRSQSSMDFNLQDAADLAEKNISNKTNPDEVAAPILLLTAYGVLEI